MSAALNSHSNERFDLYFDALGIDMARLVFLRIDAVSDPQSLVEKIGLEVAAKISVILDQHGYSRDQRVEAELLTEAAYRGELHRLMDVAPARGCA